MLCRETLRRPRSTWPTKVQCRPQAASSTTPARRWRARALAMVTGLLAAVLFVRWDDLADLFAARSPARLR